MTSNPATSESRGSAARSAASLGVVILTYGRDGSHEVLLRDLLGAQGIASDQVVVVHNPFGPEDSWQPAAPDGVRVLRQADNTGYAGGMNAGASVHARGGADRVLLLTQDARLKPGAVDALLAAADGAPSYGVLGPVLELADGTGRWSTGVVRTRAGVRHETELGTSEEIVDRDSVDGTIMLVRADAYRAAGGFEERFFMYFEETDFCLRCSSAGWKVGVVPAARGLTQPGSVKRPAVHAYLMTRNGLEYARRAGGGAGVAWRLVGTAQWLSLFVPNPFGPRAREPGIWRGAGLRLLGAACAVIDFARGRWGRPPALLTRWSDMR